MTSTWKVVFKLQLKKPFQSLLFLKSKKVHKIEQTETDWKEEPLDIEFFVETISIQNLLNINEIKNVQFFIKLILVHNST